MLLGPVALAILLVPPANDPAADYRRLIDEYRVAGAARIPQALATWQIDTLLDVVREVAPPPGRLDVAVPWLEAAALAQLEAGVVLLKALRPLDAADQIEAGRILVDRLRSIVESHRKRPSKFVAVESRAVEAADAFVLRWYVASGQLLHGSGHWLAALRHFEQAVKVYPRDVGLRLGLGTVYEMAANNPGLTAVADGAQPGEARQSAQMYRRTLLRWSVEQYQRVLGLDPAQNEARVRLGRSEMLLGRRDRAAAVLAPVRASKPSPALTYLACMLLARMAHQDRSAAEAERLYLEALAAWPDGQRAAVGLNHARWLLGRAVGADFLRRDSQPRRPDPWATYSLGQYRGLDGSIAQLRAAVWP